MRTRLDKYVQEYKNALESGSLSVPPPWAGGAGTLSDLGRTAKGGAIFNALLWDWRLGYDVSNMGSWVSTEEYGVDSMKFMQHVATNPSFHFGWLMPVPDPSQRSINWSPKCMVAAQEQ